MGCSGTKQEATVAKSPVPQSQAGGLLEDYTLGKVLGQGAFGIVYVCHKKNGDKNVEYAVKMIDKVETPLEEIRREAEMLKKFAHPNIVKLHSVYYEKVFVCMVMDIYKGGDMIAGQIRHWETKGVIPCEAVCICARAMTAGVAFLHQHSVVHRDVKGDNYLQDRKDLADKDIKIYLSDFGTVVDIKPGERLNTKSGTKVYWSPEQYKFDYAIKVDVWAIGVIVFGMLSGNFPFKGETDVKTKQIKLPSRVPKVAVDFVMKSLDKNEDKRITAEVQANHPWLKQGAKDEGDAGGKQEFKPDIAEAGANAGVADRRRDLVERLENAENAKASKKDDEGLSNPKEIFDKPFFEVSDKRAEKSTKYEWWAGSKVQQKGIGFANAKPAGEEKGSGSVDIMKATLEDHKVPFQNWGKGEAKTIDAFAQEVQGGAARLMLDASKHKQLIRVVDIVILRLFVGSGADRKFLIQLKETYAAGAEQAVIQLPGAIKEPYENTPQVCKRIAKEQLNMGDAKISYGFNSFEVFEEEQESKSFPGMRTVYKKVFIAGEVKDASDALKSKIGLKDFKQWTAKDPKQTARSFQWMSEKDAKGRKVKMTAPQQPGEISALVNAPVGLDEEKLVQYLEKSGVDVAKFGQNGSLTLQDFCNELVSGEASLEKQADGSMLRVVDIVVLKLQKGASGDVVVESEETVKGTKKSLERLPALKRRPDENLFLTAMRVVERMLKINERYVTLDPNTVKEDESTQESTSYPGLKSKYRKRIVTAVFNPAIES